MPDSLRERINARVKRSYQELRATHPDLFRRCVESASTCMFNNDRAFSGATADERSKLAADIEVAMVSLVMEALADA